MAYIKLIIKIILTSFKIFILSISYVFINIIKNKAIQEYTGFIFILFIFYIFLFIGNI